MSAWWICLAYVGASVGAAASLWGVATRAGLEQERLRHELAAANAELARLRALLERRDAPRGAFREPAEPAARRVTFDPPPRRRRPAPPPPSGPGRSCPE